MNSITQILQRCKENNEKTPGLSERECTRCFQFDPRRLKPEDFVGVFMACDNQVAMEYLQSITDIHFFPRLNMCPTSEIRRVLKFYNPNQCMTPEYRREFRRCHDTKIMTLEQLEQEVGLSPVVIGGGRGGFVINAGESSYLMTYLPGKEILWSPRACLMLMVRASDFQKRGREARPLCDKARRDMMFAAYQLAAENEAKKAEREKPKPEPQPELPKVSDDSKVVINMTPDLLTVIIKTAVTESVNAVWQKLMDSRDTFLNTYGFPTGYNGGHSVCSQY